MLSQIDRIIKIKDERQLKSLTGVKQSQLNAIVAEFERVEKEERTASSKQAILNGERIRKPGGGRKSILKTPIHKVLFVLVYCKTYPTYDDLGSRFSMSKSAAFDNMSLYFPLVQKALSNRGVLPHRTFYGVEDFRDIFSDIEQIIIDVTERHQNRPKVPVKQKENYSGKKKAHTVKNTVIVTMTKIILFIGQTFSGHNHDYKILKEEFPTQEAWFEYLTVLVDLGYQGIIKDYEGNDIQIPFKKPRKSKNNPNPSLSTEQKESNKELSKTRVLVEHAIGGMKRFNILVHAFRNRKPNFVDDVIVLCAGLWNLNVI